MTTSDRARAPRAKGIRLARNGLTGAPLDLVVSDCEVVSSQDVRREDVGIRDGRIVALGDLSDADSKTAFDAGGLFALPGLIDAHVHPTYLDDPRDCSIAALCGGVTTMLFFAYAHKGEALIDAIRELRDAALGSSLADFGLHATLFDAHEQLHSIPAVAELGVRTFKLFLAYAAQGWMSDDFALARVMQQVSSVGGLLLAHCENGPAIDILERRAVADGRADDPSSLNETRPALLEAEAVNRLVTFAEVFDCPAFVVHVTSAEALDVVRRARSRGAAVAAETCPQYLALTSQALAKWGLLAKIGPPLRTERDRESLWDGLRDRSLQTIGSDHVPKKTPASGEDRFSEAGFGAPSIETMLSVVYDEGVARGRIPITRLVELTSENPARIFGLWPRKGAIELGTDADLVLWDPTGTSRIARDQLHSRAGYSLYEGRQLRGKHVATLANGRLLAREGHLVDESARGKLLPTAHGDLRRGDAPQVIDRSRPPTVPQP